MEKRYLCVGFAAAALILVSGAQSVDAQTVLGQQDAEIPLVLLNHDSGNFLVLSSSFPFRVRKADESVPWFDVESAEGSETEPRVIGLTPHPDGLARGVYYSALAIDVQAPTEAESFLFPVALRVGLEFRDAFGRVAAIERGLPAGLLRLEPRDPSVALEVRATPGGHWLVEILDRARQTSELTVTRQELLAAPLAAAKTETYELVFPWMCLETPCGIPTASDIADVEPFAEKVSAISYERYAMHGGNWSVLSGVGNPGDFGKQKGLDLWPMAVGGYQPSESQINAMWAGRETIASGMIAAAQSRGYAGYCIDVEGSASGNSKNTFINLVSYLANRLHDNGFKLMVAHATWSSIAPIDDLAASPVDYVATMDPYTSLWKTYIPNLYSRIDPARLVWGFTWDRVSGSTQRTMWDWMESSGYNAGVAGAAAWRTPLTSPSNGVNYYTEGFETYYPVGTNLPPSGCLATHVPTDHWKGEYFANPTLSGSPTVVRDDGSASLSFAWGSGSPDAACGLPVDRFSARWTREVTFDAGTYRFRVATDDGIRIRVDSQIVLDEWRDQVANFEKDVVLAGGNHVVVVEYYENGGGATAQLSWEKIAGTPNPGEPVVVDDPDLLVTTTGKMEWWHTETGVGNEGDMVWTQNTATRQDNFARWIPVLSVAGRYRVEAYIPVFDKPSRQARYKIHAQGSTFERVESQELGQGQWMDLGTYDFAASNNGTEYVELGDLTGEASLSRNVLFDAVRFTLEGSADGCYQTVPFDAWRAEYFGNVALSGTPLLVRNEGTSSLKNLWNDSGPNLCGVGTDLFSARYTRKVTLAAGTYRFTVTSDDGVRVFVDGTAILNEWRIQAPTTFETTVTVGAGEHELKVEYYENTGLAVLDVAWQLALPSGCSSPVAPGHFRGEYFQGRLLAGNPLMVRDDGASGLAFDWGSGTPSASCNLPTDDFSVRWTRSESFEGGTYLFTASVDDGLRVRVGTTTVFDEWRDQVASFRKEVTLPAGLHEVVVEYYEHGGGASVNLDWTRLAATTVDDPELLVTATGKMEWWHLEVGVGFDGDMVWTQNTYSRRDNYARWRPTLPGAGFYRVEVFIPSFQITKATTGARYAVVANAQTHSVVVDQSAHGGAWVELGAFEFSAANDGSEYVDLGDVTGETNISRNVLFDAVRFTPVDPPPTPDAFCLDWPLRWDRNGESVAGYRARISQDFDNKNSYYGGRHTALDMVYDGVDNANQPVYVAGDGVVECVDDTINYPGSVVVIKHTLPNGENVFTQYGHLNRIQGAFRAGDAVVRGQQLGSMVWQSGSNHHLHFEVRQFGEVTWDYRKCAGPGYHADPIGRGYYDPIDMITGNGAAFPRRIVNSSHPARSSTLQALNVRSAPTIGNNILGTLAAGAETEALGLVPDASGNGGFWYEIDFNGRTAYVSVVQVQNYGDAAFTTALIHLSDLPQVCFAN